MGNHEKREVFTEKIGPFNFSLDSAGLKLRVIAVDNASYALKIPELNYLKSQLAAKRENTFVAMHIPPKTRDGTGIPSAMGRKSLKMFLLKMGSRWLFISISTSTTGMKSRVFPPSLPRGPARPWSALGFPGTSKTTHGEKIQL